MNFLRWKFEHSESDGSHCWNLRRWFGFGRSVATVWPNKTWHTWDKNGVGGFNGVGAEIDTLNHAKLVAKNAAIQQDFV